MNTPFSFEGEGLGTVLKSNRLRVPPNQREYSWEKDNVLDLLQDIANAMESDRKVYFVGTIVLTKATEEQFEIADGQQRLATTTIILAAIRDKASAVIPSDAEFIAGFATARVKVSKIARYYLRAMENTVQGKKNAAWIPVEDTSVVNLEHVMPQTKCDGWAHVTEQDIETHAHRLGNLALLQVGDNSNLDRNPFEVKKQVLAACAYSLTAMIGKDFSTWGTHQIEIRQQKLAEVAVKTWPLK